MNVNLKTKPRSSTRAVRKTNSAGLSCLRCNSSKIYVSDSRPIKNKIRRRRGCEDCDLRWTTIEIDLIEYKKISLLKKMVAAVKEII